MSELEVVRISEYGQQEVSAETLTNHDLTRLHALRHRRAVTVAETRNGWRITAGGVVGLLVLDRIRLVLEPKFAIDGNVLMRWLAYAMEAPTPREDFAKHWTISPDGYAGLVASALLDAAHDLPREGLRHDYRKHQQVELMLRGRLDVLAQATRRYGQLDQLHTLTFDRDVNTWENHVLHTALLAAGRLVSEPSLARQLTKAAAAFPANPAPGTASSLLYRANYNRLNARYRSAHAWARLILSGGGVTDLFTDAGLTADSLLLDMPMLWERVTRRMIHTVATTHEGSEAAAVANAAITRSGDLGTPKPFRPDVLIRLAGTGWLPVDAKYKTYDHDSVSADDIHQLLTYVAGYGSTSRLDGVIVHPRRQGHGVRTVTIAGPSGTLGDIHVIGIDTQISPDEAVNWLSGQWPRLIR
jgi:5-methylcytosine-specific restriction enzyme subunit McrC